MQGFTNRVAVVTGSARGIGAATAERLAAQGAHVAIIDLAEDAARAEAQKISDAGGTARGYACDVTLTSDVEDTIAEIAADFGGLDIVVNNAGINRDNLVHKMTDEDWDVALNVNLKSAFLMSRAAQRHMVPAKYGRIVNLSSTAARGNRGQVNYSAAKAGVQGLTATLAMELGPYGINVNAVAPGWVSTPMTAASARRVGAEPEQLEQKVAGETPLRRVAQPDDIAAVVTFLASDDARHVTGQTIYVNGGRR
ncbi:3-oxoacyl-ACP reductase FabG [Gordonia sp. TBRC 11910]|uniref:3-oxoacyl-[acyl-carrier-protein] reductase MabA n=1 Tax=Gordonia asplenii TaxID=2725283 RepID=A0A848KXT5_9ACTN|nr:3-oxoacyl-ACP reductase FabG [Gordonia asplenii]NMO02927.1 3-oxoacyl-ACP reductase FabG [Gordonia asplenii]